MKEIRSFIILTLAVSWIFWCPLVLQSMGIIPSLPAAGLLKILGALSPAVVGLILTGKTEGRAGVKALLKNSLTAWRSAGWVLFSVGSHLLLNFAARQLFGLFESRMPLSSVVSGPGSLIGFTILVFFFGGGLDEEIGWRGFFTARLLRRFSPIKTILFTGLIWTIWHLPLFFITGSNQALLGFTEFLLPVAALNIIITWLFIRTRSVLLCALFHTFGNLAHEIFRILPTEAAPSPLGYYIFTILIGAAAVGFLILDVRLYRNNDIMEREEKANECSDCR